MGAYIAQGERLSIARAAKHNWIIKENAADKSALFQG